MTSSNLIEIRIIVLERFACWHHAIIRWISVKKKWILLKSLTTSHLLITLNGSKLTNVRLRLADKVNVDMPGKCAINLQQSNVRRSLQTWKAIKRPVAAAIRNNRYLSLYIKRKLNEATFWNYRFYTANH